MVVDFVRATSIEEALALHSQGYAFLAGGTQINNGAYRKAGGSPDRVVSLDGLGLGGIHATKDGYTIGAGVTLQELADSTLIPDALRRAAGHIPSRNVRNMATIGGNVGAKRSDSYVIPVLIALDATLETPEGRISVEEYIHSDNSSLIVRFNIPSVRGTCRAVKESRSAAALPVVSAAVRVVLQDKKITEARVVVGCVVPRPARLGEVEKVLTASSIPDRETIERVLSDSIHPRGDFLGSGEYKRYVNTVVVADCIEGCIEEARA